MTTCAAHNIPDSYILIRDRHDLIAETLKVLLGSASEMWDVNKELTSAEKGVILVCDHAGIHDNMLSLLRKGIGLSIVFLSSEKNKSKSRMVCGIF